jgi:uncharacterized protein YigA (DUF484 family)
MKKKSAADADQVAAYLLLNPDFLESHPQVFEALDVPHPTGGAVSLVERQVAVLRERNRALTARLDAVIEAAHRHDGQYHKLFELAVALAACRDLPALLHALATHLRRDFGTDALRLLTTPLPVGEALPLLRTLDPAAFAADIERGKPRCLPPAELPTVQPWLDEQTASAAVLPLAAGAAPALLLLGAHDAERFSPELGTLLLERLARLVGAHWHRLPGA